MMRADNAGGVPTARLSRWLRAALSVAAATGLIVSTTPALAMPAPPHAAGGGLGQAALRRQHHLGAPPRFQEVPARHRVLVRRHRGIRPGQLARRAAAPSWPSAGSVLVGAKAARWRPAGSLPLQVATAHATARPAASHAGTAVSHLRVTMASHAASLAAGVDGAVFSVARADGGTASGKVRVRLDYRGFASAYGGGFGSRLRLVSLPACALSTPRRPACHTGTPVPGAVNHTGAQSLAATVQVPAAGQQAVLAAQSSTSGGTGDYKATSLSPSSQWQVGLQTGDFNWSYPLRMPPPVGGAAPSLALSYSSGATDGETAQDNSQPGQVGEGFSLAGTGYIERKYVSCGDLIKGTITGSANATDQTNATGDECWDGYNGYLSLGGHSGQVIYDPASGKWRLSGDDGSTVNYLHGASNGAYGSSYWQIITPDGTQYFFGLGQLPGYASGDKATNSVWTMPVVGLGSSDPCHNASYASSYCPNMPWRWNLDLIVDRNGNATSFFYKPQTNYYAFDSTSAGPGKTWLPYDTGGTLTDIYYGSQNVSSSDPSGGGNVYAHQPVHVQLGYSDRCTSSTQSTCDANHTQTYWPDTPWDLYCGSSTGSGCTGGQHAAPSFFDTLMLTSVTTSVYEGSSTFQKVDTWTLGYDWLSADVNSDLVLSSITHAGDVGGTVTLPRVSFGYTSLANRVTTTGYGDNNPTMFRYRLTSISSETGAQTDVGYNTGSCQSGSPPDPATNTLPCFPEKWTAGDLGGTGPTMTSWFYKYTVSQVIVNDTTGGEPPMVTSYTYCDTSSPNCTSNATGAGGAWHYDTDVDLVPAKDKSYGQWRGYQYVHVITGAANGTQSETDYTFLRGMNGDPIEPGNGGFTSATVSPTRSSGTLAQVSDSNALNGFQLEKITYNGPGGAQVSDQISWPWTSPPTATSASQPWGGTLTAVLTGTSETDTYTPLSAHANGGTPGTRHVQLTNTFDPFTGLLLSTDDKGDVSVPNQEVCTAYTYPAPASPAGLLDFPAEVKSTACGTSGSPLISDTKYSYDGQPNGTAPTAGNVTETDVYSSGDPGLNAHWVAQYRGVYDSFGRVTSAEDAAGHTTTTSYASAWGAGNPITTVTVKAPLTASTTATTTTDVNPAWGAPNDTIDPSGQRTDYAYDALGRVTSLWLPGQTGATRAADGAANYTYAYSITSSAAPFVTTNALEDASSKNYVTSYQIFDSLLRPRQTQAPAAGSTGGTEVTDTFYDSRGDVVTQNGPYPVTGSPSGALVTTSEAKVPNETTTSYDGAGRVVETDLRSDGALQWTSTRSYPGADAVTVIPPAGGTITTTYTDGRGRTSEIDQYHSNTSATGAFDATSYSYDPAGNLTSIADPGGNTWAYAYDLLGRQVSAAGPDSGTTTSTYNDLGQRTSVTDANGKTVSFSYDAAGRRTAEFAAPVSSQTASDELAAWTYDTATVANPALPSGTKAVGQLASATSYEGGTGGEAYQEATTSYSPSYQPESETYDIPANAVTGALGNTQGYTFGYTYNANGTPATATFPSAGGLPAETVHYGYNNLGFPYSMWGVNSSGALIDEYTQQSFYTPEGQPAETDLGTSSSSEWSRMLYNYQPATLRLAETRVQRESANWANDTDTSYSYDQSGNLIAASDAVTGNNQCYTYDYLARLTAAWSQATATCPSSAPGASGLGGPAPYQQTLSYDNSGSANASTNGTTGNITASTLITGAGSAATTTAVSYTYPAGGATQPHAPTAYTTATNGIPVTTTNTWTADGQLGQTTTGSATTTYSWNGTGAAPDQLASITTGSKTTTYRYDAASNLLVVKDGGTATLYLPGEELSATGSTVTGVRYYSHDGALVAARTPGSLSWLFGNSQGTTSTAIDSSSQVVTRRYYTPFGAPIGPAPPSWPGNRGFVGGSTDTTTGLTNLGAREYNPAIPSFISPDPLLDPYQPTDLNPYDYAANNPTTNSDPTGLNCITNGDTCQQVPPPHHGGGGGGNGGGGGGTGTGGGGGGTGTGGGGSSTNGGYTGSGGVPSPAWHPIFSILWAYIVNHAMQPTTNDCQNPGSCNQETLGEGLHEYLLAQGTNESSVGNKVNNFNISRENLQLQNNEARTAARQAQSDEIQNEANQIVRDYWDRVARANWERFAGTKFPGAQSSDAAGSDSGSGTDGTSSGDGAGSDGVGGDGGSGTDGGVDSSASAAGGVAPYGPFGDESHLEEP